MSIFIAADHHLGHEKMITVWKARPFDTLDAMHETIITRHNERVGPEDTTYFLGDVAWGEKALPLLDQMNGKKRLVMGNHDQAKLSTYLKYFERVYGSKSLDGIILTHIPIHPACLDRKSMCANAHGHLHDKIVLDGSGWKPELPDLRYLCMSLEHWMYAPVPLDVVRDKLIESHK